MANSAFLDAVLILFSLRYNQSFGKTWSNHVETDDLESSFLNYSVVITIRLYHDPLAVISWV
jgi:hypothetical protein